MIDFNKYHVRWLAVILTIAMTLGAWPAVPAAASITIDSGLPARSSQEITDKWQQYMVPLADKNTPYATKPSTVKPYAAGALKDAYIRDGVNTVNFYRFISGLPDDVTATSALNLKAQYGAVLLAAEDNFSHTPSRPSDMPQDFYSTGYDATSSANIYASYGYNNHFLASSIDAYMEDSDTYNLAAVGHRRCVLNPPLQHIGLGQAESSSQWTYTLMQAFDKSRSTPISYNYVAYPAAGAFPVEVFKSDQPWSVSLNKEIFATPKLGDVTVKLKRHGDNKIWTLSAKHNTVTEKSAYFNIDDKGIGSGAAIIFRPDSTIQYQAGDQFTVTIDGLKNTGGKAATIAYTVKFLSALDPSIFPDVSSKHWAYSAIQWAVEQNIVAGFTDGTFRPVELVTEEQYLKMLIAARGIIPEEPKVKGSWSAGYYNYASEQNYYLQGLNDPARRTKPLTRTAVAELVVSLDGYAYKQNNAIQYMIDHRYTSAKEIKAYNGDRFLSRAEAVQFIRNWMNAQTAK